MPAVTGLWPLCFQGQHEQPDLFEATNVEFGPLVFLCFVDTIGIALSPPGLSG